MSCWKFFISSGSWRFQIFFLLRDLLNCLHCVGYLLHKGFPSGFPATRLQSRLLRLQADFEDESEPEASLAGLYLHRAASLHRRTLFSFIVFFLGSRLLKLSGSFHSGLQAPDAAGRKMCRSGQTFSLKNEVFLMRGV